MLYVPPRQPEFSSVNSSLLSDFFLYKIEEKGFKPSDRPDDSYADYLAVCPVSSYTEELEEKLKHLHKKSATRLPSGYMLIYYYNLQINFDSVAPKLISLDELNKKIHLYDYTYVNYTKWNDTLVSMYRCKTIKPDGKIKMLVIQLKETDSLGIMVSEAAEMSVVSTDSHYKFDTKVEKEYAFQFNSTMKTKIFDKDKGDVFWKETLNRFIYTFTFA